MAFDPGGIDATISSGASLSGAIDLGDNYVVGILMPSAWTTAELTFQGSLDNSTFGELTYDAGDGSTGAAVATSNAAASVLLSLDPEKFGPVRFLKVRSGTSGTPVNQGADRTLKVIVRKRPA